MYSFKSLIYIDWKIKCDLKNRNNNDNNTKDSKNDDASYLFLLKYIIREHVNTFFRQGCNQNHSRSMLDD